MDSLIVFSHLRWNFVYQRPQHLMARFADRYRVFFFEEPLYEAGTPRVLITEPRANVIVCTPRTPFDSPGFHDQQLPALQSLIEGLTAGHDLLDPIAWLYTPMALPLVSGLHPRAIVYDCMDELAAFKNAPRQLLQREHALLKTADFVFTGGPSLYRAKQARHPSVHCFPSSVDRTHFASARDTSNEISAQRAIPHPRLGFFGVIDERLDIGLIDRLALAHPEWQLIMVGPIVKIDPALLPSHPNVHYFGQQPYEALPHFLAGWDVCLLPFALNDATRFISPTKTLEYMAAGKPIVSTPVEDVAKPHGHVVGIGEGDRFIELCELALRETPEERSRRQVRMQAVVEATSWDKTASEMQMLIEAYLEKPARESAPISRRASPANAAQPPGDKRHRVVVIGAGPTGLSAAYHIGEDCLLLEQHASVGGWCRSIEDNGFTFDYAGHIMFSNDPYVKDLYQLLLGNNVHWQDREAWIYSKGVYTRYPFQGALYGLPPEVITECIVGAVEARVGPLNEVKGSVSRTALGSSPTSCKAESITDCCADGISESHVPLVHPSRIRQATASNFEEFIYQVWGRGIAKHFALPYNRKLWAVPLSTMETSWLGGRVPLPDLTEMIEGALRPVPKPMGPNARFGYPLRGGFQSLMNGFIKHLTGTLKLNATVARVIPSRHMVMLGDGSIHPYEHLISTMPLPLLVKIAGDEAPPQVRSAASRLRHVSVRCVNLGIGRRDITDKHWIYYPESSVFHRIFMQGNASPHCNGPEGFGLTCEITYSPDKPLPCEGDALIDLCIKDAIGVGVITPDDRIIARNMVDMPYAYVVYDHSRAENVAIIREWAQAHDIVLAGRYSEWEYYNSDHAFIAGRNAALAIEAARRARTGSSPGMTANCSPDFATASQ
ncbi:MAG TPA: NAD(P)-binding protein [Steroidobacteraceae bacterium]|jgi:protoporphyrinogen oxidase/glycosyltransferase involved in cell wall biosynthesis|nr:NAD(P)-binding protein [Steroidobacteraceae bacterium]